jgi:hypothetical protein
VGGLLGPAAGATVGTVLGQVLGPAAGATAGALLGQVSSLLGPTAGATAGTPLGQVSSLLSPGAGATVGTLLGQVSSLLGRAAGATVGTLLGQVGGLLGPAAGATVGTLLGQVGSLLGLAAGARVGVALGPINVGALLTTGNTPGASGGTLLDQVGRLLGLTAGATVGATLGPINVNMSTNVGSGPGAGAPGLGADVSVGAGAGGTVLTLTAGDNGGSASGAPGLPGGLRLGVALGSAPGGSGNPAGGPHAEAIAVARAASDQGTASAATTLSPGNGNPKVTPAFPPVPASVTSPSEGNLPGAPSGLGSLPGLPGLAPKQEPGLAFAPPDVHGTTVPGDGTCHAVLDEPDSGLENRPAPAPALPAASEEETSGAVGVRPLPGHQVVPVYEDLALLGAPADLVEPDGNVGGLGPAGQPLVPGGSEDDDPGQPDPVEAGLASDPFDPVSFGPLADFCPVHLASLGDLVQQSLDHLMELAETEGLRWYSLVLALGAGVVACEVASRKLRPEEARRAGAALCYGAVTV